MEIHQIISLSVLLGFVTMAIHSAEALLPRLGRIVGIIATVLAIVVAWGWIFSFASDLDRAVAAATGVIAGGLVAQMLVARRVRRLAHLEEDPDAAALE